MNKQPTVKINPVFKALLDLPTEAERKELERQLVRDNGPRDPLVIWKDHGDIVDGHNRYEICMAHNLPYKTHEMTFENEEAVKTWMLENQLARRNLSPQRFSYYLGTLYNTMKQTDMKREVSPDGKTTSERLAERFGVSEHTVRREGDVVKGIDTVAKVRNIDNVREKLAQIAGRNETTSLSKEELGTIGRIADPKVAEQVVKHVDTAKAAGMKGPEVVKAAVKVAAEALKPTKPEKAPAPKKETYGVAFAAPAFDMSYNMTLEAKPPLADNAVLYLSVPDEAVDKGIELLKKWGLKYEASFVFPIDGYEGIWSDIRHQLLMVGTKGHVIGPKKLPGSLTSHKSEDPTTLMIKMIEGFHPQAKRLDMRKNACAPGWAGLSKTA